MSNRVFAALLTLLLAGCAQTASPHAAASPTAIATPTTGPSPSPVASPVAGVGVSCVKGGGPLSMALIGSVLYDVADPLHPTAVCRFHKTSAHTFTGTAFEYLQPRTDGTTDFMLHTLGSNNESVAGTVAVGALPDNAMSAWAAGHELIAYSEPQSTATGNGVDVWVADRRSNRKLFSYPVPLADSITRPGLPPQVLAFSPDAAYLAAGWAVTGKGPSGTVHVFRVADWADVTPALPSGLRLAVWARTGHALYLSGDSVVAWSPEQGQTTLAGALPWTAGPNFAPDAATVAFTGFTPDGIKAMAYDFGAKATRALSNQPRSAPVFVKAGWVWYLEEATSAGPDPTQPDGKVLALNLATGQESPVTFNAGDAPFQPPAILLPAADLWPLG